MTWSVKKVERHASCCVRGKRTHCVLSELRDRCMHAIHIRIIILEVINQVYRCIVCFNLIHNVKLKRVSRGLEKGVRVT
jgi:hypothetical protein